MDNIKNLIINRFKIISLLTISIALSMVLLIVRMKLNHSFFYLFLVWNLCLAVIPYAITIYLISKNKINKYVFIVWFSVWLAFLPNAPYIITDLMHLRLSNQHFMWLDALLVTSFAYNGLVLFFLSIKDMEILLSPYLNSKKINYLLGFTFVLTGFGMYLGRFLRYNSWEILQHPLDLITDILDIIIHPNQHLEAWIFTITFGMFLAVSFWLFKAFIGNPIKQH